MNIRKPVDYSDLYRGIDLAMSWDYAQMDLYYEIGRMINTRTEKGAAVAAAEYLQTNYPAFNGFSPRNVRRMRDFYRLYANEQKLLKLALKLNWTQNVVIMEAGLDISDIKWYLVNAAKHQWTKVELQEQICAMSHLEQVCPDECEVQRDDAMTNAGSKFLAERKVCWKTVNMWVDLWRKSVLQLPLDEPLRRIPAPKLAAKISFLCRAGGRFAPWRQPSGRIMNGILRAVDDRNHYSTMAGGKRPMRLSVVFREEMCYN